MGVPPAQCDTVNYFKIEMFTVQADDGNGWVGLL